MLIDGQIREEPPAQPVALQFDFGHFYLRKPRT
jgi:hypothetical protein